MDLDDPSGRWRAWWQAAQTIPRLCLRVNTARSSLEGLLDRLRAEGRKAEASAIAPDCALVEGLQRLGEAAVFHEGLVSAQDAAAVLVGRLVAPWAGERIVDFCAAPGGKTTHLAALAENQAHILATDISSRRLAEVEVAARRLGAEGIVVAPLSDALIRKHVDWADATLVDAPCTGLGTIRRHPEIRWLRRSSDIKRAATKQLAILEQAATLTRPGGRLIYATCTVFAEENQNVIARFLRKRPDFEIDNAGIQLPSAARQWITAEGFLSTIISPPPEPLDGFFAARLIRGV